MTSRLAAGRRSIWTLSLCLVALFALGCDKLSAREDGEPDVDTAITDAADTALADTAEPDVSDPTDTVDTEPDTSEPDTGEPDLVDDATDADADVEPDVVVDPIRTVSTEPVFGSMPLGNRFRDPRFSLDASVWQGYAFDQRSYAVFRRVVSSETPEGQPIMVIPGSPENAVGKYVLGTANVGSGSHSLSLWLGRDGATSDPDQVQVGVEVLGWGPAGNATTVVGAVADSSQVLGDVTWTRYEAQLDGYWGSVELLLTDNTGDALYLGAPTLVELSTQPEGVRPWVQRPVDVRRFDATERVLFERSQRRWLDQPTPQQRLEQLRETNPLPVSPGAPTRLRR